MSAIQQVVAGAGLLLLGSAFLRLASSDDTEQVHLLALEYGVSLSLVVAGLGLIAIAGFTAVLG